MVPEEGEIVGRSHVCFVADGEDGITIEDVYAKIST